MTTVDTQNSYKCSACGMTKTVAASQAAPKCCGTEMKKIPLLKPGEGKEGSCCSH